MKSCTITRAVKFRSTGKPNTDQQGSNFINVSSCNACSLSIPQIISDVIGTTEKRMCPSDIRKWQEPMLATDKAKTAWKTINGGKNSYALTHPINTCHLPIFGCGQQISTSTQSNVNKLLCLSGYLRYCIIII